MYRRVLIVVAIAGVLLVGLWFGRAPIVAAVKEWRAVSLLSKAEKATEEGRDRDGAQLATAALQLGPKKIETLRRIMLYARSMGLGDLPAVTLLVFFHEERVPADREEILEWSLERGDPAFFDQLYPNLDEEARAEPRMRLLHARKLALQGRTLEAIEEARALEDSGLPETEVSLLLASLLPRLSGNPVAARQAKERILALLGNEDEEVALRAWRLLPLLPAEIRDPDPASDPVAWISARPGANAGDRVLARRLVVERLPEEEQAAAMEAQARELLGDPEAISWVVRWYLDSGKGEQLLDLPEEVFLSEVPVFSSRLQALLEMERFVEAEAWLKKAPEGFPESIAGSLEAVFARRAGRASEALSAWRRVIDRASSLQVYSDCLSALKIAERFGEEKAASDVVEVIVSLPPNRLPPSERLEFLEPRFNGRHGEWLQFWRGIFRFRPGDVIAIEQVAFLELTGDEAIDAGTVLERTGKVLERFPTVPRFRATHALWLMRAGRDAEALALLRDAAFNWNEVDALPRAAYVLALRRNGESAEADAIEAGIRWEGIGPVRGTVLRTLLEQGRKPSAS